ncbi:MAG: hypothetical protein AB7V50_01480 [Vampirovibrionia bacterium]
MTNISGFAFCCKRALSISGVGLRLTAPNKNQNFKLYRQFDNSEKALLIEFNGNLSPFKLNKFEIKSKNIDVYSIIEEVNKSLNLNNKEEKDILELLNNNSADSNKVLRIWNESFKSNKYISDSYNGYIFADNKMHIWIYDIIPANKLLSETDNDNPLPIPNTKVTYIIEKGNTKEVVYSQQFLIPEIISAELELFNVFEQDKFMYHVGLKHNNRYIWGKFTSNKTSRRTKFLQDTSIENNDLIANICPNLNNFPNINPRHKLFVTKENPPILSNLELMESELVVSRIQTNIENYNDFNSLSFETKCFKSSNFPQTFSIIYPHR